MSSPPAPVGLARPTETASNAVGDEVRRSSPPAVDPAPRMARARTPARRYSARAPISRASPPPPTADRPEHVAAQTSGAVRAQRGGLGPSGSRSSPGQRGPSLPRPLAVRAAAATVGRDRDSRWSAMLTRRQPMKWWLREARRRRPAAKLAPSRMLGAVDDRAALGTRPGAEAQAGLPPLAPSRASAACRARRRSRETIASRRLSRYGCGLTVARADACGGRQWQLAWRSRTSVP